MVVCKANTARYSKEYFRGQDLIQKSLINANENIRSQNEKSILEVSIRSETKQELNAVIQDEFCRNEILVNEFNSLTKIEGEKIDKILLKYDRYHFLKI